MGGVDFILLREADTSPYNCVDNCVYEKVDDPGGMFCFEVGSQKVVCEGKYWTEIPSLLQTLFKEE